MSTERDLERKCQVCRRAEVTVDGRGADLTCVSCLGRVRTQLKALITMSAALLGEAITRGLNSEAFALAGPSADPEAWGYHRMSALAARIDPGWLDDQVDMHHPGWVLGTWQREAREHLQQHTDTRPTLSEARTYLDGHLTRLAQDNDFAFDELATDVRLCHDHLERVLHLDEHHDTGVECPECGKARLRKDYGTAEDDDRWTCPQCRQWWTETDYRARVAGDYLEHAKVLTIADMATRVRVSASTLRTWAQREVIKPAGRDQAGRKTYSVEAVEEVRDARAESPTRAAV